MDNQTQPSALDQAISSLHGALGAVGNFFGGVGHNLEQGAQSVGQDLQSGAGALGKAIDQSISNTGQYFDPTSNGGNNFWSTPVAQGLAGIQPHAENVLQGASLGYYQADPNLEKNVNPFMQELEKGAGAIIPFAAATALTGGAADAFLPEAFSEGALGSAVSTAGGGALTGLAAPATSLQQRLGNTVTGGITGGAFGLLGEANPIIQSAIGSLGAGGLTALQGGNPNQILANAALGLGTPLFFKAAEAFGGGDTGSNMMNNLYDKFGTDSYRFMANKELIQRVVTGQGSPEDITQFNILNRLGVAAEAARSPEGLSIEDEGTRVPKSGPVWDFLQTLFPNSFKAGAPTPDFTDPEKSPLAAIPEMALSPVENDALMKLDERNPSPVDQSVSQTHQELTDSQQVEAPESSVGTQKQEAEDTIIQALQQGNTQDATALHQAISQELPLRSLDELKTEADQRATDQQQQLASVQSAISQDSLMQHPDIAQYKDVIRKAVRTYNLTKAKGTEDISTITNRVPGLDVALQAMREKNLDIQSMDQLATFAKNLPKKGMAVRPPQTAAEAVAVKAGKIPTQPTSDIVAEKAVTPADEKTLAPEFATDEGLQPIHQVLDVANQEKPLLDQAFQELAQQNGGQFSSRIKSPETVKQKIVTKRQQGRMVGDRPYGLPDVNDLYGARITVPDAVTKANILAQIHTLAKQGTFELMNSENVEKDTYHATHMDLRTQGGTRIELQLDTPQERAEALTNHPIRSLFGEQPPEAVNKIKLRNADIINKMPADQAKQLGDAVEAIHKADPEAATTKPIDLTKMLVKGDQPLVRRGVQDVNGTLFKTNVVDDLWNHIRTAKENQEELDQPGYFATSVLKDPTWQDYLKTHSDINNHEGGPKTIADKNGYFAYIDPKTVIPDQANLNPVINKSILKQFVDNDPIIVRDNKDGTFSKVDGQHRVLTSRALENPRLPALVLDDNAPKISDSYNAVKNGEAVQTLSGRPVPADMTKMPVQPGQPGYNFATDMENGGTLQPEQAQPTPPAELKTRLQLPSDEAMVGVSSKPPFQSKVSAQVKTPSKVSLVKQNLRPLISILKNSQDPMAREIAQRYIEADANHTMMSGQARTALEDATKKLSKADYENAVDSAEGKAVPNNEAVSQWLNTYDQFRKDVATKASDVNLKIYDPEQNGFIPWEARDNYFPHFISDKDLKAMKSDPKAIQELINKGYAHDSFTAQNMINSKFSNLKSKRYGNLETSRSDFPAPYVKDPRVALDYFDGAYRRLGQAKYFGANSEIVNNLIDKMAKNGNEYEANAARQLITRVVGKNPGFQAPEEAAIKDVTDLLHNMETMTKLGFITPGHHAAALAALASRVGPVNTLKASTELLKGVVGQYSQLTRENVARVHAPQSDLYGKNAGLFDKFYSGIGLNRTLNALSAVGAHAANSRLNEMESNLTNPVWQRDMVKANIDPAAVAQRGKFTPQERTQYITSVLQDASLLIKPGDMPKLTDSQLGRMAMMLKGPAYQRTARLYPYVGKEVLHGRMSPILAFAILGTLFAAGGIVIGNQIQNKPAPTSADLLKQGALRGIGPIGGEEVANMIQYPEYTGATMAGLVGGPVASDIVNGTQIAANWNSPNENTALGARRNLVRNIPIVGPTVANTLLPFKNYIGNRPSDIISAKLKNQQITHNPGDFQYQTSPSLKDLVVQNPAVTQEKAQAANIASFDKAAVGQLDQTQQVKFDAINKFLQDPYNGGNNLSKINAYSALQNDSQMALVKSMQEVEAAKESGKPINPLWSIGLTDPAAQKIVLQYKGLLPAEQKNFKSDPVHVRVLNEYNALEADYYQKLPQSAAAKSSGITAPSPSKGASDKLNQYSASKAAGKPNYALLDDPEVKQYYSQLDFYDSYINGLAGLTGTTGSSSGGSSGYSSNNANYYERAMQRQYMYAALRDSMQMPALNLKALPTPQVKAPGQAFASLKLPQPKVALPGINGTPGSSSGPKLNRVSFKAPSSSPTRSSAIGIRTIS